jgi:hypothetical protein
MAPWLDQQPALLQRCARTGCFSATALARLPQYSIDETRALRILDRPTTTLYTGIAVHSGILPRQSCPWCAFNQPMLNWFGRCIKIRANNLEEMLGQGLQQPRAAAASRGMQQGHLLLRSQWPALRPSRHSARCWCSAPVAAAETATQQEQQPAQQAKVEQRCGG